MSLSPVLSPPNVKDQVRAVTRSAHSLGGALVRSAPLRKLDLQDPGYKT
ncbi:hypothetical protein [Pseudomonas trivialis]